VRIVKGAIEKLGNTTRGERGQVILRLLDKNCVDNYNLGGEGEVKFV
jgi:hypothetical protein